MAKRRTASSLSLLITVALVVLFLLARYLRHPAPPQFTCGTHCGEERWRIKTVFDSEAASINFTLRAATIPELVSMSAPAALGQERAPAEKQVYSVEAVLLGWKVEGGAHGDRDYHLVLADPGDLTRTMIAEAPSAECEGACSSPQAQRYAEVRQALEARLGPPQAHFRRFVPAWVVRVEGVGFFDMFHGQIGVAENCIELHPLLTLEFLRQLGPETELPRRIEPPREHHCGRMERE